MKPAVTTCPVASMVSAPSIAASVMLAIFPSLNPDVSHGVEVGFNIYNSIISDRNIEVGHQLKKNENCMCEKFINYFVRYHDLNFSKS